MRGDSPRILAELGETAFLHGLRARHERLRQARLDVIDAQRRVDVHLIPRVDELERDWPTMSLQARCHILNAVIECIFVEPGRGHGAHRTTVCPAGTASHDMSSQAKRATALQPMTKRRSWINANSLDASKRRWSPDRIERELRAFTQGMSQWPAHQQFLAGERQRLYAQIIAHGGEPVWAYRIGLPITAGTASPKQWTDERIRAALALYLEHKTAWPTSAQFTRDGLRALSQAITRRGGRERWTQEFPLPCPQLHRRLHEPGRHVRRRAR